MIPCALIQLRAGVNRLVPLEATDLAVSPRVVFPLPVDIPSLEKLTKVFGQIQAQAKREDGDEEREGRGSNKGHTAASSMDHIDPETARDGVADNNPHLPPSGPSVGKGGRK